MTASTANGDLHTAGQLALQARRRVRWLAAFLWAAGLLLTSYVGAQYFSMYAAQRTLIAEWQRQNHTLEVAPVGRGGGVVRISIPKIQLDAFVVEGTSHRALLRGPGHLKGTPEPGQRGNAVVAAHRDTFFYKLGELDQGDEIYIRTEGQVFRYVVTGKKVVEPTDLSVTGKSEDTLLTLITCYPTHYIGPAPHRLVVRAARVGKPSQDH